VHKNEAAILIIDSDGDNRKALGDLLQAEGHKTLQASDGASALASLESEIPSLVFTDIAVAARRNFAFLKKIKTTPEFLGITVVVTADKIELETVVACLQAGAKDFLLRPFNPEKLNSRVKATFDAKADSPSCKSFGNYTISRKLGSGGMADVFLAHHSMLRRYAALKILRKDSTQSATAEMFEREVQLASSLTHANTISIYDYGRSADGLFYYAMEYLDGIDLNGLVGLESPLPESRIIHILKQICASLGEAHKRGIIHRDIKPQNIVLCERGGDFDFVKVLDFGIAKTLNEREDKTSTHASPLFISPEVAAVNLQSDRRSDLYSLGAVGYYLLTGQYVFNIDDEFELLDAHVNEIPSQPSLRTSRELSPDLEAIIMFCLEKKKEDRPRDAQALYQMLGRCKEAGKWTSEQATAWWTKYLLSRWPGHIEPESARSREKPDEGSPVVNHQNRLRLRMLASRLTPPKKQP
jgi:serine/threonine protein kinase